MARRRSLTSTARCPLIRYRFPGFHGFLHDASVLIGHPEAEAPARRNSALSALANLCAQAGAAAPSDAPMIVAKAAEFRDQLHASYEAAELILAATRAALSLPDDPAPSPTPVPEALTADQPQ